MCSPSSGFGVSRISWWEQFLLNELHWTHQLNKLQTYNSPRMTNVSLPCLGNATTSNGSKRAFIATKWRWSSKYNFELKGILVSFLLTILLQLSPKKQQQMNKEKKEKKKKKKSQIRNSVIPREFKSPTPTTDTNK